MSLALRAAAAAAFTLVITLVVTPWFIRMLRARGVGQLIGADLPPRHLAKAGTPTMGGLVIVAAAVPTTLIWSELSNPYVWLAVAATVCFGAIGLADDLTKVISRSSDGVRVAVKGPIGIAVCVLLGVALVMLAARHRFDTGLALPLGGLLVSQLGWGYVALAVFVVWTIMNATNFADGLDGLALSLFVIAAGTLAVFAYALRPGAEAFTSTSRDAAELTVFCGALIGACLGLLKFNWHPARIFIGDVGSLALGSALGTVAVLIKQELLVFVICGVITLEGLSVAAQFASFWLRGRRLLRRAPLHHHLELNGWGERRIVRVFLLAGLGCSTLALGLLALR